MADSTVANITFGRVAPTICVRDIQVGCEFYTRVLGFTKVFENGRPVGFMVLIKDAAEIHLSQKPDHQASTVNVMHLFVDDVRALRPVPGRGRAHRQGPGGQELWPARLRFRRPRRQPRRRG